MNAREPLAVQSDGERRRGWFSAKRRAAELDDAPTLTTYAEVIGCLMVGPTLSTGLAQGTSRRVAHTF
jgi:hypothetical protein